MTESEKELKSLLMKLKQENEKGGLKLNLQKTKMTASSPIISRQIGENLEAVTYFIFFISTITLDSDCRYEIKSQLLFGRKSVTNLNSILKNHGCYFVRINQNVPVVKAMVFTVVMYGCESCPIRKFEH